MADSKKVTLSANGTAATVADPEMLDIITTVFSVDSALTGLYGLAQKCLLVGVGMTINSKRLANSWNPFHKMSFGN